MGRKAILTSAVMATIPDLVAQGMDLHSIAAHLGCKATTLRVRCSQDGVQLHARRKIPAMLPLSRTAMTSLRWQAAQRGIDEARLACQLLEVIAHDNLYAAIIDDERQVAA